MTLETEIENETATDIALYDDELRNLQAAADAMTGEARPLMKFQKGAYFLGQDLEEIPLGTRLAVNVPACVWGWVRWVGGKPAERRMVRLASGEPRALRDELGYHDPAMWARDEHGLPKDPWAINFELPAREVDGEQREVVLTGSSRGMENAVLEFLHSYCAKARQHRGEAPIIALDAGGYWHKVRSYGFVKTPTFAITGWLNGASNGNAGAAAAKALEAELSDDIPF